ncbi:hypothetical protein IJG14_08500 [bacterium]|nr:hypothetical protein [bacterium]
MYDKEFYEKYAKSSLKFFYEEQYKNFTLSECPDIQNDIDNIGIEVTRGISEYSGKFSRLSQECLENNLPLEQRFTRANRMFRKNFLGVIHENNAFVIADPQNGEDYYELHIKQIFEKIKIKIDKLEKLYKKFEWNCLYVFAEYPLKSHQIWVLADLMCAENLIQYDIYFINALDRLYVINAKDNFNFTKHKYTAKELCLFTSEAQS